MNLLEEESTLGQLKAGPRVNKGRMIKLYKNQSFNLSRSLQRPSGTFQEVIIAARRTVWSSYYMEIVFLSFSTARMLLNGPSSDTWLLIPLDVLQ